MSEYKYVAFVSYQRADEEWAKWFHHQLEHYHLPTEISDRSELFQQNILPTKELRPMFLDEEELAGGNLSEVIRAALNDSRYLIVLCSPNSAKSEWVNLEVNTFINEGKVNYIIPVIIDGVPYSEDPETECFVPALRALKSTDKELLGINAKAGREMASVKVVSQLIGVSFDSLWNRYEREKEQERIRLVEEKRRLQRLESRYLAEKGQDAIAAGNSTLARRIALAALPVDIYDTDDRPFVGESSSMLISAYQYNNTIDSSPSLRMVWAGFGVKGNLLATCRLGIKGIQLWDPALGLPVKHLSCDAILYPFSISSDGNTIAGAASDAIYVFDVENDTINKIPLDREEFSIMSHPKIALSPCRRYVACISNAEDQYLILLFDVETGKELRRFIGHTDHICAITFQPEGKCLTSCSNDGTIRRWNVETGECLGTLEFKSAVKSVAYNADGTKLLATFSARAIVMWQIGSGEEPKIFKGHTGPVLSAIFNSDETKIISTSSDNTVRLWNVETGDSEVVVSHNISVRCASMSADDRYLISVDLNSMRITDLVGNACYKVRSRSLDVCRENPIFVFGPDSKSIYYSSNIIRSTDDIEFFKWDLETDTSVKFTIKSSCQPQCQPRSQSDIRYLTEMRGISCLYPLDDRRILIDITNEGIYVFDTVSDAVIKKLDCHDSLLGRIVEGSTANELVICESGGDLLLLDTETLEVHRLFNTYDRFHASIAVCSDGAGNLYMMKNNGLDQVHVYNINERRFVRRFTLPHSGSGTTLEFNKDKSLMLVTTPSCIKVCDVASGQSVASLYEDARRCNSARFSPDGAYIITTCANEVKLWDVRTALCYHTIEHGSMLGKVSISPDGTKFAFSSADRQVHVQDFIPIKELIDETRAHYADIGLSDAERKALHLE